MGKRLVVVGQLVVVLIVVAAEAGVGGGGRGRGGAGRGAGRGAAAAAETANAGFNPTNGNVLQQHGWSLTIGAQSEDVPTVWLTRIENYFVHYGLRGAAALERGDRNQKLHIQAVVEVTSGTDQAAQNAFKKHFKDHIPITPSDRSKLTFKPLAEGQNFVHMLGYVQKDADQPHYRLVSNEVTAAELAEGRQCYADVAGDYKTGHIAISKAGLGDRIWSYWNADYKPFFVPQDVILLNMIRSGKFYPCGTWNTSAQGRPVDPDVTESWMLMITRPHDVKLEHIRILFMGSHLAQPGQKFRYFTSSGREGQFKQTLSPMTQRACELWYEHAYEPEAMAGVVFELRKCLQVTGVPFANTALVDKVFVGCFDAAYAEVGGNLANGGNNYPPCIVPQHHFPANDNPSWEEVYGAYSPSNLNDYPEDAEEGLDGTEDFIPI